MVTMDHVMRGRRAVAVGVLAAVAFLAIGVWGVFNLVEGDWFIGGLFVVCALFGLPSLGSTARRVRRGKRSSAPADEAPH